MWTADNQNVAATYFLVYDPKAKPHAGAVQSGDELAARLLQSRRLAEHDLSPAGNNVPNLVQMVVLNYMALHSTSAVANWPNLWPTIPTNNTLGSGAATLDPLIMYQPLASLVNGKVPG